ncbi:TAXI family TRAP transporter solute-binding subunit [Salinibacillus xinjiangensis]|uniref:TAXI family TRAP transporter solute-binding subunit n=1 Tax=Salinibacillus xinjiangensis TaxID=1229268 RepID=A0A6G1X1M5_9BACI|nr:TAXI family TRAP transporter solute-binding subunit [Salinibacillus xinjiangensis]MRG84834.1 TAXI family TRAP transporter solute-binding subunit [Salinibacillus xinjiangensis]
MKKTKSLLFFLMTLFLVVALAACSDSEEAGDAEGSGDSEGSGGEVQEQEYPSSVTIGTGSQGGTYYIWGGGLASLLGDLDVTANVEVTGGPVHNIQLLDSGDIQLGMATVGPFYEGYNGEGEWTAGNTYKDLRVIFPMYVTPFHWYSNASTGVTNIRDHEGERVGVGPAGGTPGTYNPQIYEALGIETGEQVQAGASDMTTQLLDGQLDHVGFAAGIPIAAVTEAETQAEINIYGIDGEDRSKVIEELPFFQEFTIPEGTYEQQEGPIETIGQYNFGIINKNANEDFVYDLVKAFHENNDQMVQTHASAKNATEEAILNNKEFPMHPGAIKYYEEVGIDLPDAVYPEEYEK